MKTEIDKFNKAFQAMKDASRALDKKVSERIVAAGDDESALMDIVYELPENTYQGSRRIYERILRLRENKDLTDEVRSEDSL
jgi:hypothetical protein